ncbi:hypothetical protein B0H63DRAFT_470908 [Podospora didyma]|uniref:Oxidoreductase n=1 Tax=Podospora didyma TaxID=330526 RepID=A0AAE0NU47_9PEZI|nr:hypothetical protein B0H63DRAFT_470908 [Podospora didyma]
MAFVGPSPRTTNAYDVADFVTRHHDTYPLISATTTNLAGRSVFVTGASKGIGRATAIRYAVAGCNQIAIGARSALGEVEQAIKDAAKEAGHPEPTVVSVVLDVISEDSVKAAADTISKAFDGKLDVLIANAGYMDPWEPLAESDTTSWITTLDTSLKGLYLCTRFFLPLLLKSELKTVLAVSSIGALLISSGASSYQIAKFAACRFVECVDQDHHAEGIIAIALHPGGVRTELGLNLPDSFHQLLIDTPELPADHMVWLAKERREWLSGRFVFSNWDVAQLEAKKDEIVERNLLKFRMQI